MALVLMSEKSAYINYQFVTINMPLRNKKNIRNESVLRYRGTQLYLVQCCF